MLNKDKIYFKIEKRAKFYLKKIERKNNFRISKKVNISDLFPSQNEVL